MAEAVYPMLRPRRRKRRAAPSARTVRLLAVLVLFGIAAAAAALIVRRPAPVDPQRALSDARRAYALGNYSAARNHALRVLGVAPQSVPAQRLLADAYLRLGDGNAAEGALSRARAAGAPGLAGHLAAARLLQGDARGVVALPLPDGDVIALRARAGALALQGDVGQAARLLLDRLAARPDDGETWAALGRIRLDAGQVAAAADASAHALRLRPGDPVVLTLAAQLMRTRYGLVASLPWFEAALQRDAYFYPALVEYAATLGDAGRYRDMLAASRRALAARPDAIAPLYLQAILATRAGRADLARDLLQRAGVGGADLPGATLAAGAVAYGGGRYERAIDAWRQLAVAQPLNVTMRRLLAAALLRSGDAAGAIAALAPVVARADADTYALTLAARAQERSGDRVRAAMLLDRAASGTRGPSAVFASDQGVAARVADAAAAPGDPNYILGVIRAQLTQGDVAGAVARARALVARAPGSPAPLLALGDALAIGGRYAEAAPVYARAADLAFDEPTMLRVVDAWGRAGNPRAAAAALSLYRQQNPQSLVAARLLGHWQVLAGDSDSAIETLEDVRRLVGDRDASLLADLAYAYAAADEGAVARVYARAAYRLQPMNASVCDAYAVSLAAAGEIDGARQLAAKALALAPRDPVIADHARRILKA